MRSTYRLEDLYRQADLQRNIGLGTDVSRLLAFHWS